MVIILGYIYLARNKINGKCYVGKTIKTLERRKQQHIRDAMTNRDNFHFHSAIRKYGEENFEWTIINEHEEETRLNELEIFYIQKYDTFKGDGYNNAPGGEGCGSGENHPMYGKKGKNNPSYGQKRPKISGENHPFYGKKRPEMSGKNNPMRRPEVIAKRSGENSSSKRPEVRKKISEANKNPSPETRQKMSENNGMKRSEVRKKLSKSRRGHGLFGFTGGYYAEKNTKAWMKVWLTRIKYKGKETSLGYFHDPLSCQIVYDLVWDEIYNI